jgi:ectoine hydroxylase-related dioxygenase (phytanoyl-CoA dioxygenase family)
MTASLSLEQVQLYRRDGFLAPIRIAGTDQAAAWRRELEESERKHGKLHYLAKAHLVLDFAHRLASYSSVLDAVSSIIGPDILLWDSTFIIKEPGDGKKVSWHQDLTYWGLDPDDDIVSVWLALSPATIESGCMLMIPGSHIGPIAVHHDTRASDNILSRGQTIAEPIDESQATAVVLAPGEMSLHHGRVWHGSSPNRSHDRRIGFNAQYLAPWVKQTVGDWDSALLVRGEDRYEHFEHEVAASSSFDPADVARQQGISARRAAYLGVGTG